jgi:MFS family permease
MTRATMTQRKLAAIPGGVWALGFVSMLMDISSEMIHALLPLYLVVALGASALTVGIIEGIAESTALVTKIFSGAISDRLGKRKLLAALGYGLAAFTKPIFPLASTVEWLMVARFVDRIGKGIRGAPRDALVADLSPPEVRGASFGLRQSLDTVGAFLGPLLAITLMWLTLDKFTFVFWMAVLPAFLSFFLIVVAVKEPERAAGSRHIGNPISRADLYALGAPYWWIVAIGALFTLARFSEAFLILKAQSIVLSLWLAPAVLVAMNVAYALAAYPAGVLSDCADRRTILIAGFAVLVAADVVLAMAHGISSLGLGVVLWGLHMGLTQGLLATLVADASPVELRGTAFGFFNLASGIATLVASVIAGALWDAVGPAGTFTAGAVFTFVALIGLFVARHRLPSNLAAVPNTL